MSTYSIRRPKLLFLCQTLPFPLDSGVAIRTYNVLRQLARAFDVTALCFYRWKGGAVVRDVEASVAALRELGEAEAFPIPQEHHRARLLSDHLRSIARGRAYTVFTYDSAPFRERVTGLLATRQFDLVHMDSLDLSGYLPLLGSLPVVCVHHNVESALLRRRGRVERSTIRGAYLRLQAQLTEREERFWCPRVALNVAVSEEDRRQLLQIAPTARVTVVPNGVDLDRFRPMTTEESGVVFVGGTTWFPNKDALGYFTEAILPELRARSGSGVQVTWVGRSTAEERARYAASGVSLTGYVDDIRPFVHQAACFIVPLRVGGGTRLKILDAWGMGKAVVSTTVGCEGLATKDGENILIRDTPEGFAEAVREVLGNPELRRRLGAAARATAERLYGWDAIGRTMIADYERVMSTPTPPELVAR